MTLTSDHLAWQQRVFKETHASSKFMDLERQSIRSGGAFSKSNLLFITAGISIKIVLCW